MSTICRQVHEGRSTSPWTFIKLRLLILQPAVRIHPIELVSRDLILIVDYNVDGGTLPTGRVVAQRNEAAAP
jgi:hypothetical protein